MKKVGLFARTKIPVDVSSPSSLGPGTPKSLIAIPRVSGHRSLSRSELTLENRIRAWEPMLQARIDVSIDAEGRAHAAGVLGVRIPGSGTTPLLNRRSMWATGGCAPGEMIFVSTGYKAIRDQLDEAKSDRALADRSG
jgi:hypothetical protein